MADQTNEPLEEQVKQELCKMILKLMKREKTNSNLPFSEDIKILTEAYEAMFGKYLAHTESNTASDDPPSYGTTTVLGGGKW